MNASTEPQQLIVERWMSAVTLQRQIERFGFSQVQPYDPNARSPIQPVEVRLLEHAFDSTFPCREALAGFWVDVRWIAHAGGSPWKDLAALACGEFEPDGEEGAAALRPVVAYLRDRMHKVWPQKDVGTAFLLQQAEPVISRREPQGDQGYFNNVWTSVPHWAQYERGMHQAVAGGWLPGSARWAVRLSGDALTAESVHSPISDKGLPLPPSHLEDLLPHEWWAAVRECLANQSEREQAVHTDPFVPGLQGTRHRDDALRPRG